MWKLLLPLTFAVTAAIFVEDHYPVETRYNFVYSVNDPLTHDIKNQWERRVGDKVQGSYRILEADGTTRIVDYYADGRNGFRAIVRREESQISPSLHYRHHQHVLPLKPYGNIISVQTLQNAPPIQSRNILPVQTVPSIVTARPVQSVVRVQPVRNAIPVRTQPVGQQTTKRDYYGATFVEENDYGRGLGFVE